VAAPPEESNPMKIHVQKQEAQTLQMKEQGHVLEEIERSILVWVVEAFVVSTDRVSLDLRDGYRFQKDHLHRLLL
jgi:hypothetical protein